MSPLPNITEITGTITDATDITQDGLTPMETIVYGFFAPLGIICMLLIITAWIAVLSVSIYDTIQDWRHGSSMLVSERKPPSKPMSVYLIPEDERTKTPLLYVKKWSENSRDGEDFFGRNGLPNYGTMTQMQRDEINDIRESIMVSKEMMRESSGIHQV